MFCRNCGTQLDDNADFCYRCGDKIPDYRKKMRDMGGYGNRGLRVSDPNQKENLGLILLIALVIIAIVFIAMYLEKDNVSFDQGRNGIETENVVYQIYPSFSADIEI